MKMVVGKYMIILPARVFLSDKFSFRNFISSCNHTSCKQYLATFLPAPGVQFVLENPGKLG